MVRDPSRVVVDVVRAARRVITVDARAVACSCQRQQGTSQPRLFDSSPSGPSTGSDYGSGFGTGRSRRRIRSPYVVVERHPFFDGGTTTALSIERQQKVHLMMNRPKTAAMRAMTGTTVITTDMTTSRSRR